MVRWIAEHEEIPRTEADTPRPRSNRFDLQMLVSPEALPRLVTQPRPRRNLLAWLAARDHLPPSPEMTHQGHSLLSWLTSREQLSSSTPEIETTQRSLLRWLLTATSNERLENHPSKEEVSIHEP